MVSFCPIYADENPFQIDKDFPISGTEERIVILFRGTENRYGARTTRKPTKKQSEYHHLLLGS